MKFPPAYLCPRNISAIHPCTQAGLIGTAKETAKDDKMRLQLHRQWAEQQVRWLRRAVQVWGIKRGSALGPLDAWHCTARGPPLPPWSLPIFCQLHKWEWRL